jgi:predicted RNA binding protein YcfA (HicA-like mRNA interferase family)
LRESNGFIEPRQAGSHAIPIQWDTAVSLTIQMHKGCDIGRVLVGPILKDAGFAIE